ncbi:MAG: PilZ domain-containing protein [Phycisphaerae bacterium]
MAGTDMIVEDLPLPHGELDRILAELDAEEVDVALVSRRRSHRNDLRGTAAHVVVKGPGGQPQALAARIRNMSVHGMALLVGRAIPIGNTVTVRLTDGHNSMEEKAVVVRQRHIKEVIYEIGAVFTASAETGCCPLCSKPL